MINSIVDYILKVSKYKIYSLSVKTRSQIKTKKNRDKRRCKKKVHLRRPIEIARWSTFSKPKSVVWASSRKLILVYFLLSTVQKFGFEEAKPK